MSLIVLKNFKRQHREIRDLIGTLTPLLDHEPLTRDPAKVRYILSTLAGKLMIHFAMEDHFLYPALKEKNDQRLQSLGDKFFAKTGDLMIVFQNYSQKWINPVLIRENPDSFIQESKDIFLLLLHRIEEEDQELYPILEKAG
ncbi:MAG: hemerythrin domain-containing protein [Firmicutes bacterium]|nr:hemerythrin domain-containing protein [Bacillota bacterium]